MKKYNKGISSLIVIIGIVVAIIIGEGAVYYLIQKSKPVAPLQQEQILEKLKDNIPCYNQAQEIISLIDNANYCQIDSDCKANILGECIFGCYFLSNKDYDVKIITDKRIEFNSKCHSGVACDCSPVPAQERLICENKRCIVK